MSIGGEVVKEASSLISRRSKLIFGAAALAGVVAAHPLRPISEAFQEEVYGDKNAFQKTMTASVKTNLQDAFLTTPTQKDQIESLYQPSATNGKAGNQLYGADGSLVFGLYNKRLGG